MPFALGANLTLGKASCASCAQITSRVERHISRPIAGMLRIRLGLQTRNPSKRNTIPKKLFYEDGERIVQVAPEEFPSMFGYPIFELPGILQGLSRQGSYRAGGIPWSLGQDDSFDILAKALNAKYGSTGFELASFEPRYLMSFVAKVAHATAVALLGRDGFIPMVRDAAISPDQVYDDLLGGQGGAFRPFPGALHYIEMRQVTGPAGDLIFVRLSWFCSLAAAGVDATLTTFAGSAPPPLVAIVGRPTDDRLVGKFGFVNIGLDGKETWGLRSIPASAQLVPPPTMRP